MNVGLYFGSFNPIHTGHLIIASYVLEKAELDQIWFVVTPHNPFKQQTSLLNEYDRLHLVRLAVEKEPKFKAVDIEFRLPRPSYTIDTLQYLEEKYPQHAFSIIIGSDSFQNLDKWKNADVLMKRYPFLVYNRPDIIARKDLPVKAFFMDAPLLQISATHIRNQIKEGKSIRYLVPDNVLEYIEQNGYYKH